MERMLRYLSCLLVLASSQVLAGDAPWRTATTANYRILSQLSDSDTAEWMRGFDQFVLATAGTLGLNPKVLPPLMVVIFAHDRDYVPYKLLRPNGKAANITGQFVWRPTWSMIAMAHDSFDDRSRRIIYHEATHWLMSVDQTSHPAWFSEGIAEMFSTFERQGDKVNWAKPIDEHLALLRNGPLMPLAQFLAEPSALFDRDDRTDLFYAQSWAFTHFLMFSKDQGRRQLLTQFLSTYKTQSGEATVQAVFGKDLHDIATEFDIYIAQRSWHYMNEAARPNTQPPVLQPASAELVEASLGYLALGAERTELARQHAQKAIELDPDAPEGHALLAYLALGTDGSATDLAVMQAEAALQRGSRDSEMFRLFGDSYLDGPNSMKPDATQKRVSLYENAINFSPRQVAYYDRLAAAAVTLTEPREEDAKFLGIGMRAFPGDDWLRIGGAAVDNRLGRHDAAVAALRAALRPDSKLDSAQRTYAGAMLSQWLLQTMQSELTVATDNNDYTGARAIVGHYRELVDRSATTDRFLQDTDERLELAEKIARYEALLRERKTVEARALAAELLARPGLSSGIRRHLEDSHSVRN